LSVHDDSTDNIQLKYNLKPLDRPISSI
jgi:hypothetical protein